MAYKEQPFMFDEWRSAKEEKDKLVMTDKPGGETNKDGKPLLLMTTQTNTAHQLPNNSSRRRLNDNANLRQYV